MGSALESSVELIHRARGGDAGALDELLRRYRPRLTRWATGRLPRSARALMDTGDIVQETLVKAVRHFDRIDVQNEGALQAYLRRALVNRLNDEYRRPRPPNAELDSGIAAPDRSPLEEVISKETIARYEGALSRLRECDRQAVLLRIEMCYGYEEIARMLGKPSADAARVAVSRAVARLCREMRP
ncbi:MAG TPA: sigma-70 family RNA polymerase sigma factor [Vicinamibacterales bacterium]|nr:sigma-70 family RNA polymerase sigma factor [Vicinamibacterales bacterium]